MEVKTVLITPGLMLGGAERWIVSLAKYLDQVSHIIVFSGRHDPNLLMEAQKHCKVILAPSVAEIINICSKAEFIISWGCRLLTEFTVNSNCPVVDVSHGDPNWRLHTQLVKYTSKGATHCIGVSQNASKAFPEEAKNVGFIYNGIETERLLPTISREEQRRIWNIDLDKKIMLFASRISKEKNPQIVSDTADFLPDDWECVCVDTGQNASEFKKTCSEKIKFIPPSIQIGNIFNASDVLIMPSDYEGFPLMLLEAWLFGIPTVTTEYDTYLEIKKKHGNLSWSINTKPYIKKVVESVLAANKEDKRVLLAKKVVEENYTAQIMGKNWSIWREKVKNDYKSSK